MEWYFLNGDKSSGFIDAARSGIYIQQDHIYDIQIDMHPSTLSYDAYLTDRTAGTATYSAMDLGWRNNVHGTYVVFGSRADEVGDRRPFSLDDVHITQTYEYTTLEEVAARFDGGTSTTVVDAYEGMAGDGWAGPWQNDTHGTSANFTATVDSANEVHTGDGNCLSLTMTNTRSDGTGLARVSRSFGTIPSIDRTQEYTVEFTVRIDENYVENEVFTSMTDYDDRYVISCSSTEHGSTHPDDTFAIRAMGAEGTWGPHIVRKWAFTDGDNLGGVDQFIGSGIGLVEDGVYDFVVTVSPEDGTYDVTLTDHLSNEFTATDLGWRTEAGLGGDWLNFVMKSDTLDEMRSMTIDNIVISQDLEEEWPAGDANKDNKVDASDATILAGNWQAGPGATWEMGDFNGDGFVDASDATILAGNWQFGTGGTAVPEPSTLAGLVALLLAGVALARRR
jgi:hypothetical protein